MRPARENWRWCRELQGLPHVSVAMACSSVVRASRNEADTRTDARWVVPSPALATRAMAGRQRRCLVQKEQFRVLPWRHQRASAATELQHTRDPPLVAPSAACQLAFSRVHAPAPIAHEEPAIRYSDDLAEWSDSVLTGHQRAPSAGRPHLWTCSQPMVLILDPTGHRRSLWLLSSGGMSDSRPQSSRVPASQRHQKSDSEETLTQALLKPEQGPNRGMTGAI